MSIESNDMNPAITRDNYEEYFLMYVDDELNAQEKAMVEAFLNFHPELQSEMELLMGTRLEPETLSFGFKESLLAGHIGEHSIDEDLLLHIDDELDGDRKKAVQHKLEKDETYRRQHQLLLRTKSDPAEVVPHPNKKELYRHSVHRMRFGFALRVAAAVLLIASMGVLYLQQDQDPAAPVAQAPAREVARPDLPAAAENKSQNPTVAEVQMPAANTLAAAASTPKAGTQTGAARRRQEDRPAQANREAREQKEQKVYDNAPAPYLASVDAPKPDQRKGEPGVQTLEAPKNNLDLDVTPRHPHPSIIAEPAPEALLAVSNEEGRSRGNFKSLLRKATRMVERRTGINTTNEDDELLIGVVAVKLK